MAKKQRQKIGLIFAGASAYTDNNKRRIVVKKERDIDRWLLGLPELKIIADIETAFIFGDGVGAVTSQQWHDIALAVEKLMPNVDGVVVLLGGESFVYTTAAVSLALRDPGKPIVITGAPLLSGSNKKLSYYQNLGVRANLLNAIHVALADIGETVVVYGSGIYRAATLSRSENPRIDFMSFERPIGRIDFGVSITGAVAPRHKKKLSAQALFNPAVHVLEYHPLSVRSLQSLSRSTAGLIITVDDLQRVSSAFRGQLLALKRSGVVPVIYTRGARSSDDRQLLIVNDMTIEMTLVKLMWSLAKTRDYPVVVKYMRQNVAGEKIKRPRL